MFVAVFESVFKRKETNIFLGLAVLPTLLYALGSFFAGSNFNQINSDANSLSALDFVGLLLTMSDSILLPMIALVYLTVTVFTRERDDHTLFLYKDLNRTKVFWAKVGSLFIIVLIYFGIFVGLGIVVYYTRVVTFPYASGTFFSTKLAENVALLAGMLSSLLTFVFFLMVTVFLAMKTKMGLTILITIVLDLVVLFTAGGDSIFRFLLPKAYGVNWWQMDHPNVPFLLSGMVLVTLFYFLLFGYFGNKSYREMEF